MANISRTDVADPHASDAAGPDDGPGLRSPDGGPLDIVLGPAGDLERLAPRWQALHARAGGSFFQSWTWTGCLGAERFGDAVLLEARQAGRTVALGLFNRSGGRARLGESGDPALDSVFIEHNGLLVDHPDRPATIARCLEAALRAGIAGRIVLSGVDDAHAEAAARCGIVRPRMTRPAPWLDLARVRADGGGVLAGLSANTRYQLRRSQRAYAAQGVLRIERAPTLADALDWLDALAGLHQATWRARGRPGAFAEPAFRRFHRALITRGYPVGEVDLLRVTTGEAIIGYLYNFLEGGCVSSYQSGFDYPAASGHQKPGLTCHHLALEMYLEANRDGYDFLAGGDRYKTSLASASRTLHWFELARPWSLPGLSFRGLASLRGARRVLADRKPGRPTQPAGRPPFPRERKD